METNEEEKAKKESRRNIIFFITSMVMLVITIYGVFIGWANEPEFTIYEETNHSLEEVNSIKFPNKECVAIPYKENGTTKMKRGECETVSYTEISKKHLNKELLARSSNCNVTKNESNFMKWTCGNYTIEYE